MDVHRDRGSPVEVEAMCTCRIAVLRDLLPPDGVSEIPDYSLRPLLENPRVVLKRINGGQAIRGQDLQDVDVLISVAMAATITRESFPHSGRLLAIMRVGVGYEDFDVKAWHARRTQSL